MSDELLVRGIYAPMVAVLVVPEPATFAIFLGFSIGFALLLASLGRSAFSQLSKLHKEV
jgi:hypothetical protein